MSTHHFDTEIAMVVGVPAACLAYSIEYWCRHKAANERDIRDGKAWIYNSMKAWSELLPYLSEKQIRTALDKLREAGIIEVRNLNQKQYDQTLWYAYNGLQPVENTANCPNGQMSCPNGQMDSPSGANGFAQMGRPIPYEIPNNIPYPPYGGAREAGTENPDPPEQPKTAKPRSAARGTRIPDNWAPTPTDYAVASKEGLTPQEINREADKFRDYWRATTGRHATKLDWGATWRNWVRKAADDRPKRSGGRYGGGGAGQTLSSFDRVAADLDGNAARREAPVQSDGFTIDGECWPPEAGSGSRRQR